MRALLVPAITLFLGACATMNASPRALPPAQTLSGTAWVLDWLEGDGAIPRASISFADEQITGAGPCNGFRAGFENDGDAVAIGPIVVTRKACPELDGEQRFLAALVETTRFERTTRRLTLFAEDGRPLMRLLRGV